MMKKTYMTPEATVIMMQTQALMAGSDQTLTVGSSTNSGYADSRSFDLDE